MKLSSAILVGLSGFAVAQPSLAPAWPQPATAPNDAPNIVLILLDDAGFGDAGTFGGPAMTAELDRLAAEGLRYNNFNTTSMCSPTRAALLTGRNHHRVGFGRIAELADAHPGYDSIWKKEAISVAEVLRRNGYRTAAFGKWHNTPVWEISPVGPFDRWPTGLGFEHFYGFMHNAASHWEPAALYRNITSVEAKAKPEHGYHLTTDIISEAIAWLNAHASLAPQKPYFLYLATGATHHPHHVPKEWSDRYRGQFDEGWDELRTKIFARQKQLGVVPLDAELTSRPDGLPAWDSLSANHKRLFARQMEVYAGFLTHTDHEIGRLLKKVRQGPRGENTLVLYIVGDNGSSAMGGLEGSDSDLPLLDRLERLDELGGPLYDNDYAAGWAWAGSTPFQGVKGIASHFGGVRAPLVIAWPARIKERGGLRRQFTHVTDVAPTLYDAAGITFPAIVDRVRQLPLDGVSFLATFAAPGAASAHHVQYFEMWGNRAIYHRGWVAATRHDPFWQAGAKSSADRNSAGVAHDRWELYDTVRDFSQNHDLAAQHPDKVKELQKLFEAEAHKNNVYPLVTGSEFGRIVANRPSLVAGRRDFVYYGGLPAIPSWSAPDFTRSSYRISADLDIPDHGARGVVVASGGRWGGFVLYVKDDCLILEHSVPGRARNMITSDKRLPPGTNIVTYEFIREEATKSTDAWQRTTVGTARLSIGEQSVGEARIVQAAYFPGSFGIGRVFGSSASPVPEASSAFTGTIGQVRVQLL